MKRRYIAAFLAVSICSSTPVAAAEEGDPMPYLFGVGGALLGGMSIYFAFEAQLARSHEADPSTKREGLATVFTVVSISTLILAVASLGLSVYTAIDHGDDKAIAHLNADAAHVVRIVCPNLSCLPEARP